MPLPGGATAAPDAAEQYLDLLKRVLTRHGFDQPGVRLAANGSAARRYAIQLMHRLLSRRRLQLYQEVDWNPEWRVDGRDKPADAETMIGLKRLENLHECIRDVLTAGVPGDLVETGVWRGGAAIFMRGALRAYGDPNRVVWLADSFQGLPKPDVRRYPLDRGDAHWKHQGLAVSVDEVKANFRKYGLLDDRVRFLPGWFRDTLPSAPIEQLAVLRLDGDMYESTMVALTALYPKVAVGGYVIVDDYGAVPACRAAVDDFRAERNLREELKMIDWTGAYWKRGPA